MAIVISNKIATKLVDRHRVSEREVRQAFENRTGKLLKDSREEHKSDPPTLWFIATTNERRLLKVCFIQRDGDSFVRTAYDPNADEMRIYRIDGSPTDF